MRNARPTSCWPVFAALLAALALACSSTGARSQEAQQALFCDSAAQIETVYTAHAAGIPAQEVVEALNKETGAAACGVLLVHGQIVEHGKQMTLKGDTYVIIKVLILAIFNGQGFMPVPPMEQYALMPMKRATGA